MKLLKIGTKSAAVAALQSLLGISIDSHFGKNTAEAVKAWQKENGLKADGVIGNTSWSLVIVQLLESNYKMSTHFTLKELLRSDAATHLGSNNEPPIDHFNNLAYLASQLELVRKELATPLVLSSGYRNQFVNKAVGGSKTSAHAFGLAADFKASGLSVNETCKCIAAMPDLKFDQVIHEFGRWVHLGFTIGRARRQELTAVTRNGKTEYLTGLPK